MMVQLRPPFTDLNTDEVLDAIGILVILFPTAQTVSLPIAATSLI
jgi:hypothetical protein